MSDQNGSRKRRSLMLAGGGMKVAFQAGVMQVWLDEANIPFDHADGVSGGTFNLAMYCQGMSGSQIADNWRNIPVSLFDDFNWEQYGKLFFADSILTFERFRRQIFPGWGLDWDRIRASQVEASFNVYNFSKQMLQVLTADKMTEDYLVACASIPMWFPPVLIGGNTYIDAVFMTDANIEEAIRRGADEIWVIWTVSQRDVWDAGFIANYFQIIETCANGQLNRMKQRIEQNNALLANGQPGEFGRPIDLKILSAEVPLHYLINLSTDRIKEAVNLGVEKAREWCALQGIPLRSPGQPAQVDQTTLSFTEEMKGYITIGAADIDRTDFNLGFQKGSQEGTYLMFHLTIGIDGVRSFITEPEHDTQKVEGYIECEALGGRLPVEQGWFNLFIDQEDPTSKKMFYRLFFADARGQPLTLSGFKSIKEAPGIDLWTATNTLYTRILQGHVAPEDEAGAEILAFGIISNHFLDFLKQLASMRADGPTSIDKVTVLGEFGVFFLGKLWDVYGKHVLLYGPF
ncbi:MAG TPA: patatin-like phospholipase family protein [Ktedonobacteraceae bacterium]|nr:patatin-like phospholipase family protein [Ktedonobacteraceae bacterium]